MSSVDREGLRFIEIPYPWGDIRMAVPYVPQLVVERIHPDAVLPKYAKDGDSGMDVYSTVDMLLRPQEKALVPLGLLFQIPRHPLHEIGYRWGMALRPRSGLTAKTDIEAYFGTIDNTYRNEVKVIVKNVTQRTLGLDCDYNDDPPYAVSRVRLEEDRNNYVYDLEGRMVYSQELIDLNLMSYSEPKGTLLIRKGDRIAQLVFEQVIRPLEIVEGKVSQEDSRGGGFGSTGVGG